MVWAAAEEGLVRMIIVNKFVNKVSNSLAKRPTDVCEVSN